MLPRNPAIFLSITLAFVILAALGLQTASASQASTDSAAAALVPQVFSSPIQAGCVQLTPSVCKLHIDPFTISIAPDRRLAAFQLFANGSPIYDYRTDVSNPPVGNYNPSLVALDYAAVCGRTYTINLLAKDNLDANFLNAGQVENVVCPVGTYSNFLPILVK